MFEPIHHKTATLPERNLISPATARRGLLLITLAVVCFGPCQASRAVRPAPDGGYAGQNTAEGTDALKSLTSGYQNTAVGFLALFSNTTGAVNTAAGAFALANNSTGGGNTAIGTSALQNNTTGSSNIAIGASALFSNTSGGQNTATGASALGNNTTGTQNTANGVAALQNNTTGFNNTAEGSEALMNSTGSNNIALGYRAGINLISGSNNIDISAQGKADESNKIRIGIQGRHDGAFIAGISGVAVNGSPVVVNASGKLGVAVSSARYKEGIKPMDKASEAILALQPVTFCYKQELDPEGTPQFGLVAEQVEKINPDLVARDQNGQVYTVRYEAVNAMLLNEFLKEHHKVQEQKAAISKLKSTVAQQQKGMEVLAATLKEQAARIQKVSAQLELSKPAPQVVAGNQ
jgi:hypothetical protein